MVYLSYSGIVLDKETGEQVSDAGTLTISFNSSYANTIVPVNGAGSLTASVTYNYIWTRSKFVVAEGAGYTIDTSSGSQSFRLEVRWPSSSASPTSSYDSDGVEQSEGNFASVAEGSNRAGWNIYKSEYEESSSAASKRVSLMFYVYLTAIKATLSYDANGGTGAPPPDTHKVGDFTISSVAPTRSGYSFIGWSSDPDATTAEYQAGDIVAITEDTTLYAVWTQLPTFTITVVSAGNGSVYGGGEYIVGSTALLTTAPAMGYVFDHWNDGDTSPERAVVVSADATYTAYFRRNWISVDQYDFVTGANKDADHPHGDLDRIIIDGDIMPLRTGVSPTTGIERKRILRGEDIAYLWECIGERTAVMDMTRDFMWAPVLEFKRRLDDYQLLRIMNWVRTFPREIVSHFVTYSTTLIKDSPFPTTTVVKDKGEYDWGLPPDFLDTFPEVELLSYSDLETYDMAYVSHGDPLRLSIIEALFSDISKIRRFLVTLGPEVDGTTGTWGIYLRLFRSYYFGGEGVREEWANTWSIDFPFNKYCGSHSVPIVAFEAAHWDWSSQYPIIDDKVVYLPVDLGNIPSVREIVPTIFELAGMQGWQTPGLYEDYYLNVRIAYICVDVRDKTIWDVASTS